jgi:hypothetical protein
MILAAALVLVASSAQAGAFAAAAGGTKDWIRTSSDGEWEELTTPLAGVGWDVPMGASGDRGMYVGYRASEGTDALISEYSVGVWRVWTYLETFLDTNLETWTGELTGSNEFLGGLRAGLRFDVEGAPLEVSGAWSKGADGIGHRSITFGLRLSTDSQ